MTEFFGHKSQKLTLTKKKGNLLEECKVDLRITKKAEKRGSGRFRTLDWCLLEATTGLTMVNPLFHSRLNSRKAHFRGVA